MRYDSLQVGEQFQFSFDVHPIGQVFGLDFNKYVYRKLETVAYDGHIALGVVSQPEYQKKVEAVVVSTSWLDKQELVKFNGT